MADRGRAGYRIVIAAALASAVTVPPASASPAVSPLSSVATSARAAQAIVASRAKPKTGGLRVTVSGLPAGVAAQVRVTGPGGYTKTVPATRTLKKLKRGTYRVSAGPARTAAGTLSWQVHPAKVAVKAGKTAAVRARAVFTPDPPVTPPVTEPSSPPPSTPPPAVDATAPGPVSGLAVTGRTAGSISLAWTNPADPDLAAVIVRRAKGTVAPASPTAGTDVPLGTPAATSVTDSGLDPDSQYSYAVFTRDTVGNTNPIPVTVTTSTQPVPDTTPPPVPTGLHAEPGDGSVSLSWNPVSATDLKDYLVHQGPSETGPWTPVAGSPTVDTHVNVAGLTNGTDYWFTVAARDTTDNTSEKATPVTATPSRDTTAPGPVTGLAFTARGDSFIHLVWTNPNDPDLDRIIVRRAKGPDPPAGPGDGQNVPLDTPTATSVQDTGLDKTTRYSYAIFTRDTTGNTGPATTITARTRDNNNSICAQPLTEDATWSPDYRDVYLIDCQFAIPAGVTLTFEPGTILKFSGSGGLIVLGGTVTAAGTGSDPVVFTSWRDDSSGGDTDGAGNSPSAGDWVGISIAGGTLSLVHVDVRYAGAVQASSGSVSFTVRDSSFAHGTQLLAGTNTSGGVDATVVIENNTLTDVGVVPTNPYWVFARGAGIEVYAGGDTPAVVRNNRVSGVRGEDPGGGFAVLVSGELVPANLTGNTGSDNDRNYLAAAGTLKTDFTFPTSGLQWENLGITIPAGVHATVPAGVHPGVGRGGFWVLGDLSIQPGAVLKFDGHSPNSGPIYVQGGGSLTADGTAADPITFTSWTDDSISGDTNRDGDIPPKDYTPPYGMWGGINVSGGGVASLDGTTIRFASTAVDVASGAVVSIRGRILDSTAGVRSSGFVDAVRVDWGDPSGPSPVGSGTSVQGAVTYVPWKGWKSPTPQTVTPVPQDPPDPNCKDVLVLGVRGSGEDPQGPPPDYGFDHDPIGFGARSWDAYLGFQDKLLEFRHGTTLRQVGVKYKALGVAHNPLKNDYLDSVFQGQGQLMDTLAQEVNRCKNDPEQIVLVGYSQGALAIHLALRELSLSELNKISSVILIADPAKVRQGSEVLYETIDKPAGSGVWDAEGIWHALYEDLDEADPYGDITGPLPSQITNRTVQMCHNHDEVCATGMFGLNAAELNWLKHKVESTNIDAHTNYTTAELKWLGEQAAVYTAVRLEP